MGEKETWAVTKGRREGRIERGMEGGKETSTYVRRRGQCWVRRCQRRRRRGCWRWGEGVGSRAAGRKSCRCCWRRLKEGREGEREGREVSKKCTSRTFQ